MIFPVVGKALVEFGVFLVRDVIRISCPNWLGLVQLLIFRVFLLNLLRLLLILCIGLFLLFILLICKICLIIF